MAPHRITVPTSMDRQQVDSRMMQGGTQAQRPLRLAHERADRMDMTLKHLQVG